MFDQLAQGPMCAMTIGPGDSDVAEAMAKTATTWNMIQVSFRRHFYSARVGLRMLDRLVTVIHALFMH